LPIDIHQSFLTWRLQSNIRHPPAKRTSGIIGHLDTQRTDTATTYPHYITFTVVLSGRFFAPLQPTKQALAISTECMYNARVFVVGHVWKHSRIYLFRKNMVRTGWGNFVLKRPRGGPNRPPGRGKRHLSEQLNAHSEELNATMCHQGTELVAFTVGSHPHLI